MTIKEFTMVFRGEDVMGELRTILMDNEKRVNSLISEHGETPNLRVQRARAMRLLERFYSATVRNVPVN